MTATPAPGVDDSILDPNDGNFLAIMRATSDVVDWSILSLLLGVQDADVQRIRMDHSQALSQQQAIIRAWLDNGNASWAVLVTALRDSLVGKAAIGNAIAKEHKK